MKPDQQELRAHQEWLGYLQPTGLVVSPPALVAAQAFPQKNVVGEQQKLVDLLGENDPPSLDDFPRFTRDFLGWDAADLAGGPGGPELPPDLEIALPEYGETLRPTHAVPHSQPAGGWMMLIKVEPRTADLDRPAEGADERRWNASPEVRFERLLRETSVSAGLLTNGREIRLVYASRGESSGFLAFPVAAMSEVPGRPIVSALLMLLSAERLFTVPTSQRLPAILRDSRKYQNQVSTRLAGQVLAALHELLRGFQAADEAAKGELLREVLKQAPQEVYGGLLGTLMRLVFVLYAEDRGLLSSDPVYQEHYSAGRLFERLRDDHARHPDTMDSRYGAWAQLLTLFRLIHDGAAHGRLRLPARHGRLFNPDTWDFLEGRPHEDILDRQKRIDPPRVSDGVLHRVLENLLILDGERISYRALDVEQIGSVYEAMMGFELRLASGPSVALKPHHVTVDLDGLLKAKPADRLKQLEEEASCKVSGKTAEAVKSAATVEALLAALQTRISPFTPRPIGKGGLILQPTDERRQYEVLKALCGEEHRNVMLVADADQSIYRFAGASDRFLKAFLRDFGAQKRRLSESFRCGEAIVKVALALIAKNPDRLSAEHTMTSVARAPAYVTAASYADEAEEARAVADILAGLLQQGLAAAWLHPEEEPRVEPEDLCVLGRSRYVLDSVAGELRAREIPLAFRSGLGELFESRGYRLVYNALRVVHNERDLPAPASLLAQLEGVAVDPDAQLNDVLRSVEGADDPSTAPFAGPLLRLVEGPPSVETLVQALSGVAPPPQVTDDEREVLERDAQAFRDRWGQYSRSNKDPELGGFLAELALAGRTAIDEKGVRMLTVHAAKGLEFRAVVIVGMNQGSFPDFRGLEGQGLVDERRNAYVAVTRAERRLHLSRPRTRRMPWGDSRTQQPSRFLQEMGVTMVDV